MPLKIRAFPDWGVGSDPTYLNYGYPQYFQSAVDLSAVTGGSYQLVMRVKNPLEADQRQRQEAPVRQRHPERRRLAGPRCDDRRCRRRR